MYQIIRDPENGRQRVIAEFQIRADACDYIGSRYRRAPMLRDAVLHIDSDTLSIKRSTGEIIHYYVARTA